MNTSYVLIDFENVHVKTLALLKGDKFRVKVFLGPKNAKLPVELVLAMHELGQSADYIQLGVSGANALDFHITYYLGKLTAEDPHGHFHIISKDTGFDSLLKHLLGKGLHCKRSASIEQMLGAAPAARTVHGPAPVEPLATPPKAAPAKRAQSRRGKAGRSGARPAEQQPAEAQAVQAKPVAVPAKPKAASLSAAAKVKPALPVTSTLQTVIENLHSRGTARPRTIKTLCSSIKTLRLNLNDGQIADLLAELKILGKIKINGPQVTYKL